MTNTLYPRRRLSRFGILAILCLAILMSALVTSSPVRANVTGLVLHRRSCSALVAYTVYDGFSEGNAPYFVVFAVDLNGNGNFGEETEPIQYRAVGVSGSA